MSECTGFHSLTLVATGKQKKSERDCRPNASIKHLGTGPEFPYFSANNFAAFPAATSSIRFFSQANA